MILVDSSIWIDHLRAGEPVLAQLLDRGEVLTHPFVIGELALGNLAPRDLILASLADLPQANLATDTELMTFVESAPLHGLGIGFVDAHLLASARLTPETLVWTRDRRLRVVAESCGLGFLAAGLN